MTFEMILLIIAGAFAGGFINGLAGFGTGLFALGWWLAAMPALDAVVLVIIMSLVGGTQGLFAVRNAIDMPVIWRFLLPALPGIGLGYMLLDHINITILKLVVAALLTLFGGFFAFRRTLPKLRVRVLSMDVLVGGLGGVLAAVAGLSGALMTMWCSLYDWPKAERRAVIQPFNMLVLGVVFILMAFRGMLGLDIALLVAIALPFSVLGTQAGIASFRRLSDDQFQKLLIWLTLFSGLMLAGRELVATISAT
jgi:uncharacterized membrane protein YfcA